MPNGEIVSCFRKEKDKFKERSRVEVFSLERLKTHDDCKQCWGCGLVEFNLMMSFNIEAIWNHFKTY